MIETPESGEPAGIWSKVARRYFRSRVFLGLASGLGGALAVLMLLGRSLSHAPAILTAGVVLLPLLWGLYALTVGAIGVLSRSRPLLGLSCLAMMVWFGTWGLAWMGDSESTGGEPVTVLNWNLQRLAWKEPGALECIVAAVERMNPDVLALTEVTKEHVDLLEEKLDLECVHVNYKGSELRTVGGLASCARSERWVLGRSDGRRFVEGHDWFYSFAEFRQNDRVFNLFTVHLEPYRFALREGAVPVARAQALEADALLWRISQLEDPTVVAGDFNSPRDAELHVRMREHLRDTWEVGGWGPKGTVKLLGLVPMRVDYIYASQEFGVHRSEIPGVDCTDHRPVKSELLLGE